MTTTDHLIKKTISKRCDGLVVQLNRMQDSGSWDRGFEPRRGHKRKEIRHCANLFSFGIYFCFIFIYLQISLSWSHFDFIVFSLSRQLGSNLLSLWICDRDRSVKRSHIRLTWSEVAWPLIASMNPYASYLMFAFSKRSFILTSLFTNPLCIFCFTP